MAEDLVEFLNASIGNNTIFACKIHTEKMNWKSKGYGFVQFETEGDAKKAVELAKKCRLKFEGSMLEVEFEAKEIVSPTTNKHSMQVFVCWMSYKPYHIVCVMVLKEGGYSRARLQKRKISSYSGYP